MSSGRKRPGLMKRMSQAVLGRGSDEPRPAEHSRRSIELGSRDDEELELELEQLDSRSPMGDGIRSVREVAAEDIDQMVSSCTGSRPHRASRSPPGPRSPPASTAF